MVRMRRVRLIPIVALLLLGGCSGASARSHTPPGTPVASSARGASAPGMPTAVSTVAGVGWTTFQGAGTRSGVVAGAPAFAGFRRRFARQLDGEVYGQPLIAGGVAYVATENNSVYAFGPQGQLRFRRHLGAPVPGGDLPCGDISPSGISGTPAISGGRLYAVAYLRNGHRHVLYGIDVHSGRVMLRSDVDPPQRLAAQERGALLVDHGRVYVPYGGLFGDCGDYHGYVVSVTTSGRQRRMYANPSREAGIWSTGGISENASGGLLVATGNGQGGGGPFRYANSVLRLSGTLTRQAAWAPRDWASLSGSDTDIGSMSPAPLAAGRVFQGGKDGVGYLLRPGLGGVGGEAYRQHICAGAYGGAAVAGPLVLVPCLDALVALRVTGDRFTVAWRASGHANTPLVAGGAVIDVSGGGSLRAYRLSDGHPLASASLPGGANHFPSAAASGDTLAAPAGRSIVVFGGL